MNTRFHVQISTYQEPGCRTYSSHRSPHAAARALARAIRRVRGLDTARVWCSDDNRRWPLDGFRAAIERGDYLA